MKSELGRDISRRIIARERALLQLQFLEELRKQPFCQFVTLTGGPALRGVYLQQPWGDSLSFEVPSAINSRFGTLTDAFGEAVYREGGRFVFRGRAAVASKTHLYIVVSTPRVLPLVPEERLFVAGTGRTVPVRVAPLDGLLDNIFRGLRYSPRPTDLLELWLLHQSDLFMRENGLNEANARKKWSSFTLDLTVEQIRQLKARWQSELSDVPFPLPPLVHVYKDLMNLLPRPSRVKEVKIA